MITEKEILEKVTRGTTDYRNRNNPKKLKVLYVEDTWALLWRAGSRYGCGYGQTYVSGSVELILIPENIYSGGGPCVWDTGRDAQGTVTPKRLARIIEVVSEEVCEKRDGAAHRAKDRLAEEFTKAKT